VDSHRLRPRYQSDLLDEADRARLDAEFPCAVPGASVLLHDPARGEVHALSPAADALLQRCDGRRTVDEVLAELPAEAHDDASACLAQLAAAGLLTGFTLHAGPAGQPSTASAHEMST
jgi:hypothetical protein